MMNQRNKFTGMKKDSLEEENEDSKRVSAKIFNSGIHQVLSEIQM